MIAPLAPAVTAAAHAIGRAEAAVVLKVSHLRSVVTGEAHEHHEFEKRVAAKIESLHWRARLRGQRQFEEPGGELRGLPPGAGLRPAAPEGGAVAAIRGQAMICRPARGRLRGTLPTLAPPGPGGRLSQPPSISQSRRRLSHPEVAQRQPTHPGQRETIGSPPPAGRPRRGPHARGNQLHRRGLFAGAGRDTTGRAVRQPLRAPGFEVASRGDGARQG